MVSFIKILFICLILIVTQCTEITFSVDVNIKIREVPIPFYGFTIDWWTPNDPSYGKKWGNAGVLSVNFSNENFIALTREVCPAFLRIGGSPEDSIIYNISGACLNINASLPGYSCSQTKNNYGCLNISRWQQINDFAVKTNCTLLFGLNACYGRSSKNESMNFTNIQGLFDTTVNTIDSHKNLFGFELGNELSSIEPAIYAQDFNTLHTMIQSTFTKSTPIPYLVGADIESTGYSQAVVTNLQTILNSKNVSSVMHSLTYHSYPSCPYPGNGTVFDLSCLERIQSAAIAYLNIADSGETMTWMGEGSEIGGGGRPNISNTFVDCFYYLYQLCDVLAYGVTGTMRSDLIGGDYELIDHQTFLPNPDYFILYLFKMFVGNALYAGSYRNGTNIRCYAFNGVGTNGKNQIVVALINFDLTNNAVITFNISNGATAYMSDEYHLTSDRATLQTATMMVNSVKMQYVNGQFPKIEPKKGNGKTITMDPATLAFVVLTPQSF